MIASPVISEKNLQDYLKGLGFQPTKETTNTGTFWKNNAGKHVLIPFSEQGFYPTWMLADLEEVVGKIDPWSIAKVNR